MLGICAPFLARAPQWLVTALLSRLLAIMMLALRALTARLRPRVMCG
jgi:hypothetical protein